MQRLIWAAAMTASLVTTSALAQDVEIKTTQLRSNIHMLTGQGGNIGLFHGEDGTFMVDDQFAPLTAKIIAAAESVGAGLPNYLINTHFHGDHTGGNENLGSQGTLIMAHHRVYERLTNGSFVAAFNMKSAPANKAALPKLTYAENMALHINGETIQVYHVPNAHTDGDSFVVFEKANVIHAGDVFFNGFFPFMDAAAGGSLRGVIAGVDAILSHADDDTQIIPGHGPLANRADLQAYRDMLAIAYERLLKLKNQGVSVEDAVAQSPLADLDERWGKVIFSADKWIEVVYPGVY